MKLIMSLCLLFAIGCNQGPTNYGLIGCPSKFHCGDRVRLTDDSRTLYVESFRYLGHVWHYQVSDGVVSIEVKERELIMVDEFNPGTQHLQFNLVEPAMKVDESTKADKET